MTKYIGETGRGEGMAVNADRIKGETNLHRVYHSSQMERESISIRFANRLNNRKSAGTIVLFSVLLGLFFRSARSRQKPPSFFF